MNLSPRRLALQVFLAAVLIVPALAQNAKEGPAKATPLRETVPTEVLERPLQPDFVSREIVPSRFGSWQAPVSAVNSLDSDVLGAQRSEAPDVGPADRIASSRTPTK
jgi:hypothetical protein